MNGPFSASLSSLASDNAFGLIALSMANSDIPSTFYLQNNFTANLYFFMSKEAVTVRADSTTSSNFSIEGFTTGFACTLKSSSISDSATNVTPITNYNVNANQTQIADTFALVTGQLIDVNNRGLFNAVNY